MLSRRYRYNGKAVRRLNSVQITAKKVVEGKIKSFYKYERYDCECGNRFENLELLAQKDRYGLPVDTRICPKCGLIMTNPRMTQECYDDFYDSQYRPLYTEEDRPTEQFFADQAAHGREIYKFLKEKGLDTFKSVLEIGTGAGGILYGIMEKAPNTECTGIDLGEEYIDFGKGKGITLRKANSSELVREEKTYDLVILSHVLEHFVDLKTELDNIRHLLNEEGLLYIEVPGIKNIPFQNVDFLEYLQNAHIRHFTYGTLCQVMSKYGFTPIMGDEYVRSVFKKGQSIESDIKKNYYEDEMNFLKALERKNFWLTHIKKPLYLKYKQCTTFILKLFSR